MALGIVRGAHVLGQEHFFPLLGFREPDTQSVDRAPSIVPSSLLFQSFLQMALEKQDLIAGLRKQNLQRSPLLSHSEMISPRIVER